MAQIMHPNSTTTTTTTTATTTSSNVSTSSSSTTTTPSSTTSSYTHITIPKPPERHISKSLATVLSGGLAGAVSKTCTAPLTRVQLLSQTGACQTTIINTIRNVISDDGILSLWRGNFVNCIRVFPHKSILFTCNDTFRYQLSKYNFNSSYLYFITGATAGVIATIVTYPMDYICANIAGTFDKNSKSIYTIIKKTIYKNNNGIFGLYAGLGVTIAGSVPYEGCRIGVYNVLRDYIPKINTNYGDEPHPIGKLMCGAMAGAVAGTVTYPSDTLRRMLQVQTADGMPMYNGVFDCIQQNMKEKGMKRFYRGMSAKLARVVPDAAILFVVYEYLKDYFENVKYVSKQSN